MQLSLRKARKLEAKIQAGVDAMDLKQAVQVRVLASKEDRDAALAAARTKYNNGVQVRKDLIVARFVIRELIAEANAATGINTLMSQREAAQALLAKSVAGVDALDSLQAEDQVTARKSTLDGSSSRAYGDPSVTVVLPVSTEEDVEAFKASDIELKKALEEIEDSLSQKNMGVKITLNESVVKLLQDAGLV